MKPVLFILLLCSSCAAIAQTEVRIDTSGNGLSFVTVQSQSEKLDSSAARERVLGLISVVNSEIAFHQQQIAALKKKKAAYEAMFPRVSKDALSDVASDRYGAYFVGEWTYKSSTGKHSLVISDARKKKGDKLKVELDKKTNGSFLPDSPRSGTVFSVFSDDVRLSMTGNYLSFDASGARTATATATIDGEDVTLTKKDKK